MAGIYQLYGELGSLDYEINELVERRKVVMLEISKKEECLAMQKRADIAAEIIRSISSVKDPTMSLFQSNDRLQPFMHNLPRKHFENIHEAWPGGLPSNWTRAKAAEFFISLTKALEKDVAYLRESCNE